MTGTKVIDSQTLVLLNGLEGAYMSAGQVNYVDVVTHTCAIWGVIVVTEDTKLLADTDSRLCNVGHKVVRDAVGVLAYQAGLVGTDGIEITE